ncbi:MAG: type II toxin-antitoxin system RatA family toxin [Methylotenera sp.]|nr:type II toxin-antitoxin system RatA family toxin [Methylotenera sp.]
MAQVKKTVLVFHSAENMFTLVDDVSQYPAFLPWCGGVDLIEKDAQITVATLHIAYHGIKQKFTTKNEKSFPATMKIELKDGPFKHLNGTWQFTPLNALACKIDFSLNYEFESALLEKIIAPVFNHIANTFVDGFVTRADNLFKKPALNQ